MGRFIKNLNKILRHQKGSRRINTLVSWIKILIVNRFVSINSGGVSKMLDFRYQYGHRGSFYGMFTEMFIDQNYLIEETQHPIKIIDAGSNIGISLAYFRMMAPNAEIISFEPNPNTFNILNKNVAENNLKINLNNVGLGDEEGAFTLYTDSEDLSSQSASVTKHLETKGRPLKGVEVKIKKLSDYISQEIDFLKLDIEGSEGEVLEDLVNEDKLKFIRVLFLEYHSDELNTNYPLSEILKVIEDGGFRYEIFSNKALPFVYHKQERKNKSYKITAWRK